MKPSLLSFSFLMLLLTGCTTANAPTTQDLSVENSSEVRKVQSQLENFSAISLANFIKLSGTSDYTMIDIRTPEEIASGKINDDALEIDFYAENFAEELEKLDKTKKYLVYCASGRRSGKSMKVMKELGFEEAYDLSGGYLGYKSQY